MDTTGGDRDEEDEEEERNGEEEKESEKDHLRKIRPRRLTGVCLQVR